MIQAKWKAHAGLALATLLVFAQRGYRFGIEDLSFYLPFLMKWIEPSLFPHDFYVGYELGRSSIPWALLAKMGVLVDLEPLFLILYVAVTYLTLLYVFRTARLLWDDSPSAWLAVLILTHNFMMIPGKSFPVYLTARLIGTLIGTMLLYYFLREDRWRWGVTLAVGVALYPIMVVPVGAAIGAWSLLKRRWRSLAVSVLAAAAGAGALIGYWRMTGYSGMRVWTYTPEWYTFLEHVAPGAIPTAVDAELWARFPLYAAGFLAVWIWAFKRRTSRLAGTVLAVGGALLALQAVSTAILVFWRSTTLTQLGLYRGLLYVIELFMIGLAGLVMQATDDVTVAGRRQVRWLVPLLGISCMACWIADDARMQLIGLVLLLVLAGLPEIEKVLDRAKERLGRAAFPATVLLPLGLLLVLLDRLGPSPEALQRACLILCVCLLAGAVMVVARPEGHRYGLHCALGAAMLLLAVLQPEDQPFRVLLRTAPGRAYYSWAFPGRTQKALRQLEREQDRLAIEDLASAEVPLDATVVVPPDFEDFRWRTRRSSFVTWGDLWPSLRDEAFARMWMGRMLEIRALDPTSFKWNSSLDLSPEDVVAISQRHRPENVNYLVTERDYPFPLEGRRGRYRLYRIPDGGLAGTDPAPAKRGGQDD